MYLLVLSEKVYALFYTEALKVNLELILEDYFTYKITLFY